VKVYRFAAIDVGSNSVRLLFMNVLEDGMEVTFKKSAMIREPLRLGDDVFSLHQIREFKIDKLMHIMMAFRHLILAQDVIRFKALGTTAMREASNGQDVIDRIRKECGIAIQVVSPEEEARIIYSYQLKELIEHDKNYLYVDVGGGSTAITIVSHNQPVESRSFQIGTIRMLLDQLNEGSFTQMNSWLRDCCSRFPKPEVIATGGDINRIYRYSEKTNGKPLSYKELNSLTRKLKTYSVDDRVKFLGFNPDRADVITIAADIYLDIMKVTDSSKIWVPQIGLADGIVQQLYDEYRKENYL
jgi:exopolyphosphatase/guanosine-5'-triphosphate,3'-diphosphate pyrophosphatase